MDLRDPAVLPNATTVDSLKHWMLPTEVQVRRPRRLLQFGSSTMMLFLFTSVVYHRYAKHNHNLHIVYVFETGLFCTTRLVDAFILSVKAKKSCLSASAN